MSFLGEIKRRKVFQVAAVYVVVAWLLVQVVTSVEEPLNLPEWSDSLVIVLLAVGFPIAVILAWAFDLTPQGIKVDSEVHGRSTSSHLSGQRLNYFLQGLVLIAVGFLVVDQYVLEPAPSSIAVSSAATAAAPQPVNRFDYDVPEGQSFRNANWPVITLSRDGRQFVYNTVEGLYLRTMGELEARLIPGTEIEELITGPFFSADGQSVGYFYPGGVQIKRVSVGGGAPTPIADVGPVFGANWGSDGEILFGQGAGIFRVSADGGTPILVIPTDEQERIYGPQLLPGGDSVLFSLTTNTSGWDAAQIVVQSLSTGVRTVLVAGGSDARYLRTGHLVYAFEDKLFGVAFDPDNLTVSGGAVRLVQGVMRGGGGSGGATGAAQYDVSEDGTLVYVTGSRPTARTLVWVDRLGTEETIPAEPSAYVYPRISPDGLRVALDDRNTDNDIWVWDFVNQTRTRLTIGEIGGGNPVWTENGERIAYDPRTGYIEWKAANNTGNPERLAPDVKISAGGPPNPYFFSPSGTELVFRAPQVLGTGDDIGMIAIDGNSEPVWLLREAYFERNAELSPDGHWMAYQSNQTGRYEIYVRPFPNVDDDSALISNAGGVMPLWSRDGRELFYLESGSPDRLMSVSVSASETEFSHGARTPILEWPYLRPGAAQGRNYDVSPDGQRFLAIKADGTSGTTTQIIVVQNWFDELNRLVPPEE